MTPDPTVARRLAREADSCTVSFMRDDGQRFTCVGYGDSLPQRYLAAVEQLPAGDYTVAAVSTPNTVLGDIRGRVTAGEPASGSRRGAGVRMNAYEGKRVCRS